MLQEWCKKITFWTNCEKDIPNGKKYFTIAIGTKLKTLSASRRQENVTWKTKICPKLNYNTTLQYSLTYYFSLTCLSTTTL